MFFKCPKASNGVQTLSHTSCLHRNFYSSVQFSNRLSTEVSCLRFCFSYLVLFMYSIPASEQSTKALKSCKICLVFFLNWSHSIGSPTHQEKSTTLSSLWTNSETRTMIIESNISVPMNPTHQSNPHPHALNSLHWNYSFVTGHRHIVDPTNNQVIIMFKCQTDQSIIRTNSPHEDLEKKGRVQLNVFS